MFMNRQAREAWLGSGLAAHGIPSSWNHTYLFISPFYFPIRFPFALRPHPLLILMSRLSSVASTPAIAVVSYGTGCRITVTANRLWSVALLFNMVHQPTCEINSATLVYGKNHRDNLGCTSVLFIMLTSQRGCKHVIQFNTMQVCKSLSNTLP